MEYILLRSKMPNGSSVIFNKKKKWHYRDSSGICENGEFATFATYPYSCRICLLEYCYLGVAQIE